MQQDGLDARADLPRVGAVERMVQPVQLAQRGRRRARTHAMAGCMVAREQPSGVAQPRGDDVEGAAADVVRHLLLEPRDADARLANDLSAIGRDAAIEELHDGALPCSVAPEQTHALAALDGEARAVEHERPAERDADVLHPQQCHRYDATIVAASRESSSRSEAR